MKKMLSVFSLVTLCGCSTMTPNPLSFAPPPVDLDGKLDPQSVDNAVAIVDLHIEKYETAQTDNANARQAFEVPAIVALIGGVAATAFGGARDGVLVAGTANSSFRAGNSYFAPQAKAGMFANAISALYCIRQVARGPVASSIENNASLMSSDGEAVIHKEVLAGVLQVRSALASRLSAAGGYSAASGIAAEYEQSIKSQNVAAQSATENAIVANGVIAKGARTAADDATFAEAQRRFTAAKTAEMAETIRQCALKAVA